MTDEIKIPNKIKVAAFDIEIKKYAIHQASILGRFGEFSCSELCIRIDPDIMPIKRIDTLIHELNHAIYWVYGMEDEDKEERVVATFATAWTQVYRDNPELLNFISINLNGTS